MQNPSLVPVVENNWPLSGVANETVKTVMEKPRYLSFADYDVSIADEFITNYLIGDLTIEYEGHSPWKVHELVIGERVGKRPPLPEHMQKAPAESSRLLAAAGEKNLQRQKRQIQAVSYRTVHHKEENGNV